MELLVAMLLPAPGAETAPGLLLQTAQWRGKWNLQVPDTAKESVLHKKDQAQTADDRGHRKEQRCPVQGLLPNP